MSGMEPAMPGVTFSQNCFLNSSYINQGNASWTMSGPADRIELFNLRSAPMRAFHMAWLAFFLCFFAWFGVAPLIPIIREELNLTKDQIAWCLIGSVSITILARLIIGYVCDRLDHEKLMQLC